MDGITEDRNWQPSHAGVILILLFNYFFILANLWRLLFGKVRHQTAHGKKVSKCRLNSRGVLTFQWSTRHGWWQHLFLFCCFTWNHASLKFRLVFSTAAQAPPMLVKGARVLRFFRFILTMQQRNQKGQKQPKTIAFFFNYSYTAAWNLTKKYLLMT